MAANQRHALTAEAQQTFHNILSAYFRTKPLEELVDIKDRSKRPMQLTYIALAGIECSACASISQEFSKQSLRGPSLEVREGVIQELSNKLIAAFGHNEIVTFEFQELLTQAMCSHDAGLFTVAMCAIL